MKKYIVNYFSKSEIILWSFSAVCVLVSFFLFDKENYLILCASLIGTAYLIFNAKGNPAGQVLVIIFSLLYGIISYSFSYFGEMITYLGMTLPMAVLSLVSWLKNPYGGKKSEVTVGSIGRSEVIFMSVSAVIVTTVFYFILQAFHTANIIPGTLSVTTSFIAVYLTYKRNPFYAAAYAANDIILIILWILASTADTQYISVAVCFFIFLINDIYSFFSWQRMKKRQADRNSRC